MPSKIEALPRDIQHYILHSLPSFRDLHALILSSPYYAAVYRNSPDSICRKIALRQFPAEAFQVLDIQRPGGIPADTRELAKEMLNSGTKDDQVLAQILNQPELQEDPELSHDPKLIGLTEVKRMVATARLLNGVARKLTDTWKRDLERAHRNGEVMNSSPLSDLNSTRDEVKDRWLRRTGVASYVWDGILGRNQAEGGRAGATTEMGDRPEDLKVLYRTLYVLVKLASSIHVIKPSDIRQSRLAVDLLPYSLLNLEALEHITALNNELMFCWFLYRMYWKATLRGRVALAKLLNHRRNEVETYLVRVSLTGHETTLGLNGTPKSNPPEWDENDLDVDLDVEYVETNDRTILIPKSVFEI